MNYIRTPEGLSLVIQGQFRTVASTSKAFPGLLLALAHKADEAHVLALLEASQQQLESAINTFEGLALQNGTLHYRGEPIEGLLAQRLLTALDEGMNPTMLLSVHRNIQENPSKRVASRLYPCLECGSHVLTEDGEFLAYTTTAPSVDGPQTVAVRRNQVEEDATQACAHGLNVFPLSAPSFTQGFVPPAWLCKVSPRDVVAVPAEYPLAPLRVCRYELLAPREAKAPATPPQSFVLVGLDEHREEYPLEPPPFETADAAVLAGLDFLAQYKEVQVRRIPGNHIEHQLI